MKQPMMKQQWRSTLAEALAPRRRTLVGALVFLLGALVCTSAWAGPGGHGGGGHGGGQGGGHGGGFHGGSHGGHGGYGRVRGGGGFFIGGPAYWGYGPAWYGYSYYDQWPVAAPQPLWYFCDRPQGYYPAVTQCSMPWRTIVPTDTPPSY